MTVKELIKKLAEFDLNKEVVIEDLEYMCYDNVLGARLTIDKYVDKKEVVLLTTAMGEANGSR